MGSQSAEVAATTSGSRGRILFTAVVSLAAYWAMFLWARGEQPDAEVSAVRPEPAAHAAASTQPARTPTPGPAAAIPRVDVAQSPKAAPAAIHTPGVKISDIESYLQRSMADAAMQAEVSARLEDFASARDLAAERDVQCRGAICKLALTFGSLADIAPILGARPMAGSEFTYELARQEFGTVGVTIYRTTPGVSFTELLP